MPNRILREGINSSPRVNRLSMGAELLYRRLMSVVDDYGRYYGAAATVRGACWPVNPHAVSEQDVSNWIAECSQTASIKLTECLQDEIPLISLYVVNGCTYLQINDFKQVCRSKSRFPQPEIILHANGNQNARSIRSSECVVRSSECVVRSASDQPTQQHTPPLTDAEWNAPHPDELGRELVGRLMPNHWTTGPVANAIAIAARILGQAVNPRETLEAICRTHATHVVFRKANPKVFKPTLAKWLADGDYLHDAPKKAELPTSEDGW